MTYREKYETFERYEKFQAIRWKSAEVRNRDTLYECIWGDSDIPDELADKSFSELVKMYDSKVKAIEYLDNIIQGKTHSPLFRRLWNALADTEVRT